METTYELIKHRILESIPENFDDREVLEVLEHIQSMIDMWTNHIRERISDSYV